MDDSVGAGPWTITAETRAAVLLTEAAAALAEGAPERAVAIAEEILDTDPDDTDALLLIAEAAPRYGHAEVGVLAARQARARGVEPGTVEAAALLAACEVEEALVTADARIGRNRDDARAHAVRGQALEALGRLADADAALAQAHALDPARFPLPPVLDDWDHLWLRALGKLEPADRDELRAMEIILAEAPTLTELRAVHPPASPSTLALVLEPEAERPTLHIYQRNLARGVRSEDEAIERLVDALQGELDAIREGL